LAAAATGGAKALPQNHLAAIRGPTSKGRGRGEEGNGGEKEKEWKGGGRGGEEEGREGDGAHTTCLHDAPCLGGFP